MDGKLHIVQELETDGWIFKVGDIFSSPYSAYHFKIEKIEIEEGCEPYDAFIYGFLVHPDNHAEKIHDDSELERHRAWYLNDYWSPEQS